MTTMNSMDSKEYPFKKKDKVQCPKFTLFLTGLYGHVHLKHILPHPSYYRKLYIFKSGKKLKTKKIWVFCLFVNSDKKILLKVYSIFKRIIFKHYLSK